MQITNEQLHKIMPAASTTDVALYLPHLNRSMPEYAIDTPLRAAHFIAQIGHESGSLRYVEEIASGRQYEGRSDLGNRYPGDGERFKGRGLLQLTGRANYTALTQHTGYDFVGEPQALSDPRYAVLSACWFWQCRHLNRWADADDLSAITRRINGGLNGIEDRRAFLQRAKEVMQCL